MLNITKPDIAYAPGQYDPSFFNTVFDALRLYFSRIQTPQQINITKLNINTSTLPTDASIASLRSGDVYRDTTAGNALKIVP